jgi:hypothetical protein
MITILSAIVSIAFRLRARAFLELELIALRHQVIWTARRTMRIQCRRALTASASP